MTETPKSEPIVLSFTPAALARIQLMHGQMEVPPDYHVRVGIKGAGCGGMSYLLGFDSAKPEDQMLEVEGMTVLMDKRHGMYLLGMEVDHVEEEFQTGFVFTNPSAKVEEVKDESASV